MRTRATITIIALAVAATGSLTGCFVNYLDDCKYNVTLACYYENAGGGGAGGGTTSTTIEPGCIPSNAS